MVIDRRIPKRYCDDWTCPQKWQCAKSFARSKEYWAMDEEARLEFYRGHRTRWGCFDFEHDVARPWLKSAFHIPGTPPPTDIPINYTGPKLVK